MSKRSARRVRDLSLEEELGESFGRYAEKVILDRAIPDIRDGLKPVQRRIIYAMFEGGNTADKPYRKCAKTVGDVMGNYHPHGDSAIYDALVRLAQPWKMRYPLVDGHGNFGSMDDDPAAAMRYTEARLSPIAEELMADIDQATVPWRPNFDEKTEEPVVLPGGFLNLLVNGTSGVSAGFATDVPSHNLGEVTDAALAMLEDPELGLDGVMRHVLGPDFPTGGILMGMEGLREAYQGGKGKVVLRARHTVEKLRDGKRLLVFTEIPYQVVKSDLVRQIDALRLDKGVNGVLDVRDETDREGLRVVVEVARGADADGVLALLLKKTDLQVNYHLNMVTIWRNTPRQVGIVDILRAFLAHRREVVRRRSAHQLSLAQRRMHEVQGLIRALDVLDEVIATIRRSKDRADARANLEAMRFSAAQADAILDLRLVRLTNLQIELLVAERDELKSRIEALEAILGDAATRDRVVGDELRALRARHADPRRTTVEAEVERLEVSVEALVKPADVVVGVTRDGWVKRVSMASFQGAGGARRASGVRPGDSMQYVVGTNTRHVLLLFTASGQCYPIPVHQIPEAKWGDLGTALVNVCGVEREDRVVGVVTRDTFPEDEYFLFVTRGGRVKATAMQEFQVSRSAGIVALKLGEGDALAAACPTDRTGDVILLTELGQGIRFAAEQVSVQGRAARGVRGMRVAQGDGVHTVVLLAPEPELHLATFTASGRAKLTPTEQYPRQNRGGRGVRMIVSRATPHRTVALVPCALTDHFDVVDTHGVEHSLPAQRIPMTRRDGNAWSVVALKDGALVALVERVRVAPQPNEQGGSNEGEASPSA